MVTTEWTQGKSVMKDWRILAVLRSLIAVVMTTVPLDMEQCVGECYVFM